MQVLLNRYVHQVQRDYLNDLNFIKGGVAELQKSCGSAERVATLEYYATQLEGFYKQLQNSLTLLDNIVAPIQKEQFDRKSL